MHLERAASVAAHLLVVPQSASTNAELRERASDAQTWGHLSALVTDTQTAGRGRLDRAWVTPPGSALAVSVLLRELPDDMQARGWIPLAAGVAMTDAVAAQLPGHEVGLKWPNDVLVDGRKICGILAEATADAVIVGSGVNTTMSTDQLPVPTATSFAALGASVDVDRLLADYLTRLGELIAALAGRSDAAASDLLADTVARCVTIGQRVRVMLPGGAELHGTAVGIDEHGRLMVDGGAAEHPISAGDVVHVRPA